MEENLIGVVGGLGHIGLIQAACLSKLGYNTTALEKKPISPNDLLSGKLPFYEPGLKEIIRDSIKKETLSFTSQVKDLAECNFIFICVGTPSLPGGEADVSQVLTAVNEVARNRKKHCLAVIKSTVPVGTNQKISSYLEDNNLSERVTMVSNPEFLREGSGVMDFWEPSRIVVGARSREAAEKVAGLYRPPGVPIIITGWENAELIKYASNAFLANKISFINEISILCEKTGGNIGVVSKGIGLDPRINPYFLEAGVGFSGPCLEKDLLSIISQFKKAGEKAKLLEAILDVNKGQQWRFIQKIKAELGTLKGRRIAVLGMAFKPGTDDVRNSHSLPIVKELLTQGAAVTIHDPCVNGAQEAAHSQNEFPEGVKWVLSPYEAVEGKDAALILTSWAQYCELDLKRLKALMSYPLIIDGRNVFNKQDMKELGIIYLGVGI